MFFERFGLRLTRHQTSRTPTLAQWIVGNPARLWLLWLVGTALASVPVLLVGLPPLSQHFFNVVRLEILTDPAAYARDFAVHWDAVPDLALDVIVPGLARLMTVEQATLLVVLATLALMTSGTIILSRAANGRWSPLPLLSFLFLYNWILLRGYENNLLGLGLSLWALALHVALRRSIVARTFAACGSALVLYFCHLFPLAVFAEVVGFWELGCLLEEGVSPRRTLAHLAAVVVPLVLPALLLLQSSTGELGGAINFDLLQIGTKIIMFVEALTFGNRLGDAALLASLGIVSVVAIGRGWLRCEPRNLLVVLMLPAIALVAPLYVFASGGVPVRYGLAVAFVLAGFLDLRAVDPRLQRVAALALALAFLFRIGTVAADWRASDGIIETYRTAFASLKPGSVLFQFDQNTAYASPLRDPGRWNPPLDKIVALATHDGVLVPELYLKRGQQPVLYRNADVPLRAFQVESDSRPLALADDATLRAWLSELRNRFPDLFDRFSAVYVAVYDRHRRLSGSLPDAHLIRTLPEHRLYQLDPAPG